MRNTLKAYERLKREQHIDTLFRTGKAFSVFPLKCVFLPVVRASEMPPTLAGFSVPKKKFRKSVDRQRVKRLMREAWRLQKHVLATAAAPERQLHVFFIFTGPELPDLKTVQAAMAKCIDRLMPYITDVHA